MNTTKTTLASTILAAALTLMATPASAHDCTRHDDQSHKHCDTGGGGGGGNESGPANPVIAFLASSQHTSGYHAITVMDADGGNRTVVLDNPGGSGFVNSPSWSPDGRFLAFSATENIFGCRNAGLVELIDPATNEWSTPVPLDCNIGSLGSPTFHPIEDGDSYTLATSGFQDAEPINPGQPDERISSDLIIVAFTASDIGSVNAGSPNNISNTPGISEVSPSWSPSGNEIVVQATDFSLSPSEPSTWVRDVAIYDAVGDADPISLVTGNLVFPDGTVDDTDDPDWAKTNEDMILFGLELVDGDWDIYCVDISTSVVINVTQHLDVSDGAELDDWGPAWLPDDSGFLFSRDSGGEIVEMRFDTNYIPADGCPDATDLENATTVVLAKGKKRQTVHSADYLRNAAP